MGRHYHLLVETPAANLMAGMTFLTCPTNAMGFTLQQNSDLLTAKWQTVPNQPVISNLSFRVAVAPTNRQNFYRLENP